MRLRSTKKYDLNFLLTKDPVVLLSLKTDGGGREEILPRPPALTSPRLPGAEVALACPNAMYFNRTSREKRVCAWEEERVELK
mmetsp:Transcript_21330/g.60057  ORF Transcript_21330/g.60057 Transcript_21330/m.60057 type:complete len:83 (+) Transcript_21330:354-602(+)